ncbi:MAG TPA: flagellar basal body L-ring protein FlgH [Chthonomonadales bacterium]|nr:flagellar basal body L-ring protein FlgH [Chthonomonadales bacterium]
MRSHRWLSVWVAAALLPCAASAQERHQDHPATLTTAVAPVSSPAATAERPTGSLWGRGSRSLIADRRASRVGDVLTILVQETTTAASRAATQTSRDDRTEFAGLSSGFGTLNRLLRPFDVGAAGSTSGQGQTNRSGSLITRISVTVKEVLEGGNLRVEGTREVTINKETQKVTIRGLIRPDDIGPGNTVSSVAVAEASIRYDGRGPVGDRQRKGLLSTVFDWLF